MCVIGAIVIIGGLVSTYFIEHNYKNNTKAAAKTESVEKNKKSAKDSKVKLVIDTENKDTLPKNFRTTGDKVDSEKAGGINLTGLADLNISGSGALSEKGLEAIKQNVGDKPIIDVDLRQESHGFINGMGISWFGENDGANKGLARDKVIADEKEKLDKISEDKHITFDQLAKGKSINTISEINNLESVQTEEELTKKLGTNYLRITATDHERPLDEQVDLFVQSVRSIPNGTWLHFHCRGGDGRTTSFMSMYDMMHNAQKVSFEDIMNRQHLIGGSDLLKSEDKDGTQTRKDFLKEFYDYSKNNQDGFQTSWSQWLKSAK